MNTADLKLQIKQVQFADGSVWPEEKSAVMVKKPSPNTATRDRIYSPTDVAALTHQEGQSVNVEGVVREIVLKSKHVLLEFESSGQPALRRASVSPTKRPKPITPMLGDFGTSLIGKRVRLKGVVSLRKGKPEIEIRDIKQIELLGGPPK